MRRLRKLFENLTHKESRVVTNERIDYRKSMIGAHGKLVKKYVSPTPGTGGSEFRYISAKGIILNYLVGRVVKVKCKISGDWRDLLVETTDLKFDTFYVQGKYVSDGHSHEACDSEFNCACNDPDMLTDWIPEQDICVNIFW